MPEVGDGVVPIKPDFDGFRGALSRGMDPELDRASRGITSKIGGAFKAAALVGGAFIAAAGITRFLGDSISEAREANKVGKLTENIIKTTGGAAKVTAGQVGDLATRISNLAGVDDELIQTGANLLLTFKNVRNELGEGNKVFDRATQGAVDLSAAGFGSVESASIMLGKALNDPIKGITALGRAGVTFTDQQKEQIKTLVETGDVLGAQKIILQELESQVGGSAAAMADPWDKFRVQIGNLKEAIGTSLLPALTGLMDFFSTKVLPGVEKVIDVFKEDGLAGVFSLVSKEMGKALDWIGDEGLPMLVEKLGDWGQALLDWIGPRIGPFLVELGRFLEAGLNWMVTVGLPGLWEKLNEWGKAFIDWVGRTTGPFLVQANRWLEAFTNWMTTVALPEIGKKLGEWGDAFVDWLLPRLPEFLVKLAAFTVGVTYWMATEGVAKIINAAIGMGKALIDGFVQGTVERNAILISNLQQLPGNIVNALPNIGRALYQKGRELISGFIDGIKDAAGGIGKAIGDAVSKGVSFLDPRRYLGDGMGAPPGATGPISGGTTLAKIRSILPKGLSITSTYRTPARNRAVGGSPTSYHLNRSNPAVDIVGPFGTLNAFANRLRSIGGWRELLWQVKGHYDHVHVAHDGGTVSPSWPTIPGLRADERPAILQTGEQVIPRGGSGGEFHWHQEAPIYGVNDLQSAILGALETRDSERRRLTTMGAR